MSSSIVPTIGRKVWLWSSTAGAPSNCCLDSKQPYDGSIVFVHDNGTINVAFFDHMGQAGFAGNVPIYNPQQETDSHMGGGSFYATWMPYQVGQAKK